MNKFTNIFSKVLHFANFGIALFMLIILLYSAITSTPIETLINWQWWLVFFGVTSWDRINSIYRATTENKI